MYPSNLKKYAIASIVSFALGAGVFSAGFAAGTGTSGGGTAEQAAAQPKAAAEQTSPESLINISAAVASGAQTVSSIIKNAANSVVSINVMSSTQVYNRVYNTPSAGSGIIFSEDDTRVYIVTNNHVIDGANSVTISLDDTTEVPAHLIGTDAAADIAVIYVNRAEMTGAGFNNYKIAGFGDSDQLQVGDLAIAIGNAVGEGKSATLGIISAVDKTLEIDSKSLAVIQTDAAINPGNSGGALINSQSQVIGINTAKLSAYGVEGMGYSIPINEAKAIVNSIMANKDAASSQPALLGIAGETVTPEIKELYSFPSTGVFVQTVYMDTGAYAAGLRRGDLIVAFDGQRITSMEDLSAAIAKTTAGQTVELSIYKSSATPATLQVTMSSAISGTNF
ncbi:MAG: trypsin-like peptidase domain-containing protein [Clostridiales bacterium]|nr:trypsin-like peptidase domain-containing protein [Clostridiales bacterium]